MMKRRTLFAALLFGLVLVQQARGQELGELIGDVGESYSEQYLQPLADALGSNLNAGLFHTARVGGGMLPLIDVYAGVRVMGSFVPQESRSFSLTYETEQSYTASDGNRYRVPVTFTITDAPTVFGETSPGEATATINETVDPGPDGVTGTDDDVVIDETASFDLLPGLVDTPVAPFIVPQLGLGSLYGTDLVIRYLPRVSYQDYGSLGLFGLGVRHSISQYIPLFPLSLSAQVVWQNLSIEDAEGAELVSASNWAANLAASKSFMMLTVYGGLQLERSGLDVAYRFDPEDPDIPAQEISFDLRGDNTYRLIAGAAVNVGPMLFNIDAAVGSRSVLNAGVGISL